MKKPITRIDLIADMLGAQSAVVRQRQELRRLNAALVRRNTTIRRLRGRLAFERGRGDEPRGLAMLARIKPGDRVRYTGLSGSLVGKLRVCGTVLEVGGNLARVRWDEPGPPLAPYLIELEQLAVERQARCAGAGQLPEPPVGVLPGDGTLA